MGKYSKCFCMDVQKQLLVIGITLSVFNVILTIVSSLLLHTSVLKVEHRTNEEVMKSLAVQSPLQDFGRQLIKKSVGLREIDVLLMFPARIFFACLAMNIYLMASLISFCLMCTARYEVNIDGRTDSDPDPNFNLSLSFNP